MIDWIKRKARAENGRLTRMFAPDGVVIVRDQSTLSQDVTQTAISLVGGEVDAFLHQLESDGYTQPQPGGYLIPWNAIYDLLGHPDCAPSLSLLKIPDVSTYLPALESHNSLTDQAFSISI